MCRQFLFRFLFGRCQGPRISELKYGCLGGVLEVRVLRRWSRRFHDDESWFLAVDKHGDAVQVFAAKTAQSFVEAKFRLHSCYSIADYTCAKPDKYQKILPALVCVNVGRASNIRNLGDRE
ncbi:hypothetical protein LXL04_016648 [Taraxacum kok-saghyz]